ncbi:cellulase family glycosylhydrolase [Kineococcus sp. SYSU DK006]|uniref:cellulase family glycosylhydrolase n=1 Tax=Kineococcus sp. SYSU DK006 TaxID=3383127 RepID=UPI003D7E07F8
MQNQKPRRRWPFALGGATFTAVALAVTPAGAAVSGLIGPTQGVILEAPNGTRHTLSVDDAGKILTTPQKSTTPTTPPTTTKPTAAPTTAPAKPAATTTVQAETGSAFTYAGNWESGASDEFTHQSGATAVLKFTGTRVVLHGTVDAHHANATVTVDGKVLGRTTSQGSPRAEGAVVFTAGGLADGNHTLVLTAGGTFSLDKAVITGTVVPGTGPTSSAPKPSTSTTSSAPKPSTSTTTSPATPAKKGFVTRSGSRLMLDGQPYKYVGYNAINLFGCTNGTRQLTDPEGYYKNVAAGMTDRLWVMPGEDMAAVDRAVAAAKANDAKLIITLFDALGCKGPKWDATKANWGTYKSHVDKVVNRYKDSPTIMAWEIANEPPNDRAGFDLIGGHIKSLDKNHLVASGTSSTWSDSGIAGFRSAALSPHVDILSMHEYDTMVPGASPHTDRHVKAIRGTDGGQAINKPIIIGEFGIDASPTGGGRGQTANNGCVSFAQRATLIRQKTDGYLSIPEVAGVNYWSVGRADIGGCDSYMSLNDKQGLDAMKAASAKWSDNR